MRKVIAYQVHVQHSYTLWNRKMNKIKRTIQETEGNKETWKEGLIGIIDLVGF